MSFTSTWDDPDFAPPRYKTHKDRGRYPKVYKNLLVCKKCNRHDMCNDDGVCSCCMKKGYYYEARAKMESHKT